MNRFGLIPLRAVLLALGLIAGGGREDHRREIVLTADAGDMRVHAPCLRWLLHTSMALRALRNPKQTSFGMDRHPPPLIRPGSSGSAGAAGRARLVSALQKLVYQIL